MVKGRGCQKVSNDKDEAFHFVYSNIDILSNNNNNNNNNIKQFILAPFPKVQRCCLQDNLKIIYFKI